MLRPPDRLQETYQKRARLMENVAFISDVASLPRFLRVRELFALLTNIHPNFSPEKARSFLEGTDVKMEQRIKNLSKGMIAQLHLAVVMAIDAKLLVLDEPTLGLDITYRKRFYRRLLEDYMTEERTLLITTHQVDEIEFMLSDIMFIRDGDLILHMVFYARIGKEKGVFDITDVLNGICEKLIARHPHIYGDISVKDEEEVKQNWEKLKLKEGKKSVLQGVPVSLPSMVKAYRIQEKAKQVGFEWENKEQVWDKVEEEMEELHEMVSEPTPDLAKVEEEFGDVLFALINYARYLKVDPETALEKTNKKFISRFTRMEQQALQNGKSLADMTLGEMDAIWDSIKKQNPGT